MNLTFHLGSSLPLSVHLYITVSSFNFLLLESSFSISSRPLGVEFIDIKKKQTRIGELGM